MESIEQDFNKQKGSVRIPEVPDSDWETLVLLQRHGRYDSRRPVDPEHLTDEEKERLGEALMSQVPEFTDFLRQEYGGQGEEFWKNFFRDTHKEKREEAGAEGPTEIADRMNEFLNVVARFARMYHKRHPGRKLVPWIVGHGDSLEPYIHRVLEVPESDFGAGYNDGVGISIDSQGRASTEVKNKKYEVPFVAHGKPSPLQPNKQE